jgi:hypothetical protein
MEESVITSVSPIRKTEALATPIIRILPTLICLLITWKFNLAHLPFGITPKYKIQ